MAKHSFWIIVDGETPTSFRSPVREDLLPTLTQLQRKQPQVRLMWFDRGRLWDSPEAARDALHARRQGGGYGRGRDWRPGGDHVDPRAKYDISRDEKRARFKSRQIKDRQNDQYRGNGGEAGGRGAEGGGDGGDRPFKPQGDRPRGDRPFKPRGEWRGDRPHGDRPRGDWRDRPRGDRPFRPRGDRPPGDRPFRPKGDRPFKPRGEWRGDRPQGDRPKFDRPRGDRPFKPRGEWPFKPREGSGGNWRGNDRGGGSGGGRRPWKPKKRDEDK